MASEGSSDLTERDVDGRGLRFRGDHVIRKLSSAVAYCYLQHSG